MNISQIVEEGKNSLTAENDELHQTTLLSAENKKPYAGLELLSTGTYVGGTGKLYWM